MLAYKGFQKDLTCLGYQFVEKQWNRTEKANCRANGFHCAENPLDCLVYYPAWKTSVYYQVKANGDLDEDAVDSKISCTELFLERKLEFVQLLFAGVKFMVVNPKRRWSKIVRAEEGDADQGYAVVRGKNPRVCGKKEGDILVIAREKTDSVDIERGAVYIIDGVNFHPGIWYDVNGKIVME